MHLDEEQLQRAIHGELRPGVDSAVREHLGACPECRARFEDAERDEAWLLERLSRLDHRAPRMSVADVTHRAPSRTRSRARMAAGLILALAAAGVAYAAPGSPLPAILDRFTDLMTPDRPVPAPVPASGPEFQAGIAVDPGARLTITFVSGENTDTAFVSLEEEPEVVVKALGGNASFDLDADRLIIRHADPANFEIWIPHSAPLVELRVNGRRLLLKEAQRITAEGGMDQSGRYVVPLFGATRR